MEVKFGGVDAKERYLAGSYSYKKNGSIYGQENFTVSRINNNTQLLYDSEFVGRVSTGELLKINVIYIINKNGHPQDVSIKKALGRFISDELYQFSRKNLNIQYTFVSAGNRTKIDLVSNPKNTIATPVASTSGLFTLTKKLDLHSDNYYSILTCNNLWEYEEKPFLQNITLRKIGLIAEDIEIDGHEVNARHYEIIPNEDSDEELDRDQGPRLEIFLSHHSGIPYKILQPDGIEIIINKLHRYD
jgi:hypothetical protein